MAIEISKKKDGRIYYFERQYYVENGVRKRRFIRYLGNKEKLAGILKRCSKCGEWLPADNEFFPWMSRDGKKILSSWCKACFAEYKAYVGPQRTKEPNGLKLFARG